MGVNQSPSQQFRQPQQPQHPHPSHRSNGGNRGKPKYRWLRDTNLLLGLWLTNALIQILWLHLDQSVPSWDPAKHLIGSLNYWWTLQDPHWVSPEWWERLWMLSSSYAPLLYILTAPIQNWLGPGADQAVVVNLGFNALLLASVYGLGCQWGRSVVGLWAATLCLVFPRLYTVSLDYLLDYGAMTLAIFSFFCLTCWRGTPVRCHQWGWAVLFGIGFGCMLLLKQTLLLFFLFPLAWVLGSNFWQGQWQRLGQLGLAGVISLQILWPWVSTNWIFMIGAGGNSLGNAASSEGDPAFNTWAAWTYYPLDLPAAISWPLLLVPIVGLVLTSGPAWRTSRLALQNCFVQTTQCLSQCLSQVVKRGRQGDAKTIFRPEPSQKTPDAALTYFTVSKRENRQIGKKNHLRSKSPRRVPSANHQGFWLWLYILGGYVCWSLISNKDNRYIMPYLPVLAVVLADGLTRWQRLSRYPGLGRRIPGLTLGLAVVLMMCNLFALGPVGDRLSALLAPHNSHPPYLGAPWPHAAIIDQVIQTNPYQLSNLGLLTSSIQVNAETLNYYGSLRNFQVYTRGVGNRNSFVEKDVNSLSWFIAQVDGNETQLQEPEPGSRIRVLQTVDRSPEFERVSTWRLPDSSSIYLYHRRVDPVQVTPLTEEIPAFSRKILQLPNQTLLELGQSLGQSSSGIKAEQIVQPVYLNQVQLPELAPPGQPIPVTYEWLGSWQALHQGMVLLTWRQQLPPQPRLNGVAENPVTSNWVAENLVVGQWADFWIHDHGIGLGTLRPGPIQANQFTWSQATIDPQRWFLVTETMAMLPPVDAEPGIYALEALYLDPTTGKTTPLVIPPITLTVDPQAPAIPAPELDWNTQLRQLAAQLPQGPDALNPVFDQLNPINLYDPIQNYLVQTEKTLEVRLRQEPDNLDYTYGLVLSRVMQRKANGAIAALRHGVTLDPTNPYGYAYLAFVNLTDFRIRPAQKALAPALRLKPDSAEIQGLDAVAALFRGNLAKAWVVGRRALELAQG